MARKKFKEEDGIWKTLPNGVHIFIKDGESLVSALSRAGISNDTSTKPGLSKWKVGENGIEKENEIEKSERIEKQKVEDFDKFYNRYSKLDNGKEKSEIIAKYNNISNDINDIQKRTIERFRNEQETARLVEKPSKEYNIGSNKLLSGTEKQKMQDLVDKMNAAGLTQNSKDIKFELADGWEDRGAEMKWTAPFYQSEYGGVWALNPNDWLDYMNGKISAEDLIEDMTKEINRTGFKNYGKFERKQAVQSKLDKVGIDQDHKEYDEMVKQGLDKISDRRALTASQRKILAKYEKALNDEEVKSVPFSDDEKKQMESEGWIPASKLNKTGIHKKEEDNTTKTYQRDPYTGRRNTVAKDGVATKGHWETDIDGNRHYIEKGQKTIDAKEKEDRAITKYSERLAKAKYNDVTKAKDILKEYKQIFGKEPTAADLKEIDDLNKDIDKNTIKVEGGTMDENGGRALNLNAGTKLNKVGNGVRYEVNQNSFNDFVMDTMSYSEGNAKSISKAVKPMLQKLEKGDKQPIINYLNRIGVEDPEEMLKRFRRK